MNDVLGTALMAQHATTRSIATGQRETVGNFNSMLPLAMTGS